MAAKKSAGKTAAKPAARPAARPAAKKAAPAKKVAPAKKAPQSMPYEQGKWASAFTPRAPGEIRYWLIKSEPDVFSYEDLEKAPRQTTCWDSVRNSSARNFLRDGMKKGDLCFYYHSNADPSGIAGVCEVVKEGYPDPTAWDPNHDYFDPKCDPDMPTWFMVDVKAVKPLPKLVSLDAIKATPALSEMALVRVGRLSVVPVTPAEWKTVLTMGGAE